MNTCQKCNGDFANDTAECPRCRTVINEHCYVCGGHYKKCGHYRYDRKYKVWVLNSGEMPAEAKSAFERLQNFIGLKG